MSKTGDPSIKYAVRVVRLRLEVVTMEVTEQDDDVGCARATKEALHRASDLPDKAWTLQAFSREHYAPFVEACVGETEPDFKVNATSSGNAGSLLDYVSELCSDRRYMLIGGDTFTGEGVLVPQPWFVAESATMIDDLKGDWIGLLEASV